nr:citrate lyase holo-[acyl-carrier protein] synthase [Sedimentibacter sp.]
MIKNNFDMKIIVDILDAREARANKQKELLSIYSCTLISFTLNTPGAIKYSELYRKIHDEGMEYLLNTLKKMEIPILNVLTIDKSTGNEGFISVNMEPIYIKKITVYIEDTHPLGRIFDFDVLDINQNQISRSNIKLKPRKCLMCDENVLVCMRTKKHSYEELKAKVEEIGTTYFKLKGNYA